MIDIDYPDLQPHREEHARLLSLLDDKLHTFAAEEASDGSEIVEFVFQWFALHTTQVDKQIALHMQRG